MATFFGEVNFLPSRAFEDEEDDDELIKESFESRITFSEGYQLSGRFNSPVIISYGCLANEFLQSYIDSDQSLNIGDIEIIRISDFEPDDTGDFHKRKMKPSKLYETSSHALICQSSNIIPSTAYSIIDKILSLTENSCPILILCSYHYTRLNEDIIDSVRNKGCVTYTMQTSSQLKLSEPPLPQPTTLDSLPAAVMTKCIIQERQCVIYAAFTEVCTVGNADLVSDSFNAALALPTFTQAFQLGNNKSRKKYIDETLDRYI